jgi:general secretion pathway protein G
MRNVKKQVKKAFTLIEILIVVVILGILAAIVVPQFTSATQDSQAGNLKTQLGTLQRQLELYYAKNNVFPALTSANNGGWGQAGEANTMIGGSYLKEPPKNPAGELTDAQRIAVTVSTASGVKGAANFGWVFNTAATSATHTQNTIYASYFNETTGVITTTAAD